MRFWGRVVAVLAVAGCSGSVPNADHITGQNVPILASSVASDEAPPIVFNTQMRSDIEVPACATESQGHAQIKILQVGIFAAANGHFASAEAGLAELLAHPGDFYVNFHSDNCPGGFARGFLP